MSGPAPASLLDALHVLFDFAPLAAYHHAYRNWRRPRMIHHPIILVPKLVVLAIIGVVLD